MSDTKRSEKISQPESVNSKSEKLRAPVVSILGHIDAGKTKLLEQLCGSSKNEVGGITQQLRSAFIPNAKIKTSKPIDLPGLLFIDNPGHECFNNLRNRTTDICDVVILVVDILHGLQATTLECLTIIKAKHIPFIIALNKIDRIYEWNSDPWQNFSYNQQEKSVKLDFDFHLKNIKLAFSEQGWNTELYNYNDDKENYIDIVPISANTGEGIPDLLYTLINNAQMRAELSIDNQNFSAYVLETKVIDGYGVVIDTIVKNGQLRIGDKIALDSLTGPITTRIKVLLDPETKSKIETVSGCVSTTIVAPDLHKVIPGSPLFIGEEAVNLFPKRVESLFNLKSQGVYVQAATFGALESILLFLHENAIPVSDIGIENIHLSDIKKAAQIKDELHRCILGWQVNIDPDVQKSSNELCVTVFLSEIIYHLETNYVTHVTRIMNERRRVAADIAIFPCALKIKPHKGIFMKGGTNDPIILAIDTISGTVKVGTPIIAVTKNKDIVNLGKILSIQSNQKPVDTLRTGDEAAIKLSGNGMVAGRHFQITDPLYSLISRESIDALKTYFVDSLTENDKKLIMELKSILGII